MNQVSASEIIREYLQDITDQYSTEHAIEHAYRPALKRLMESSSEIRAVNDPRHSEHGAPDFVFLDKNNQKIIKGYAEAKDITISLDKTELTEQMKRYGGYANLFLTNYLEFRFYKNGEKYETISLGEIYGGKVRLKPENGERLIRAFEDFFIQTPEKIRSGRRLAQIMGGKARRIRDNVNEYISSDDLESGEFSKIFGMMKKMLVHDLEPRQFSDMYAQTLVYGLFVARYADTTPEDFSRIEARDLVPKSNPFLRHFFDHIVGPDFDSRLSKIVDELCEIFTVSDVRQIVHKHLKISPGADEAKDPIIHFYEDFLQEYDPKVRRDMGAYYTPTPVVKFIVQSVDKILKEELGIADGLASSETITRKVDIGQKVSVVKSGNVRATQTSIIDKEYFRVQILDPAVGTATFLNETIKYVGKQFAGQEGRWPSYVRGNLIQRLHGFELMMAPYTIAHLKLGMTLQESGVAELDDRLGVYLTNTLEEGIPLQQDLFNFGLAQAVSDESQHAAEIKSDRPIMIVMGNPPYSGISSNETKYANDIIQKYKVEPGGTQRLQERKHWLNDDYVKFIAFAEDMICKNGSGVMAMITNNGYINNPTFRGMRWHLSQSFDKIYIVDLHGDAKKEIEVNGEPIRDENVFDIMQGVSIILAIKKSSAISPAAEINYAEITGTRKSKFEALNTNIQYKSMMLDDKYFYFSPQNTAGSEEYSKGISLDDLFIEKGTGILTARDKVAVDINKQTLQKRVDVLSDGDFSDDEVRLKIFPKKVDGKYKAGDSRGWQLASARRKLVSEIGTEKIKRYQYRPFDERYIYYSPNLVDWPRTKLMGNFEDDNFGLCYCRQLVSSNFAHALVVNNLVDDSYISNKSRERGYIAPLYTLHSDGEKTPNFNSKPFKELTSKLETTPSPEQVFDYIYAVLYSPSYRNKYKSFLKKDFPRIPVPSNDDFVRLSALGFKLRSLHLNLSQNIETTYPNAGDNVVDQIKFNEDKIWINEIQYFGNVSSQAWNFQIGGYFPAQKWLKDRVGMTLTGQDLDHYQKLVTTLHQTQEIMLTIG